MTHNSVSILNDTDKADVKAREFRFISYSEESEYDRLKLDKALRDVSFEVRYFNEENQLRWLIMGADHISLGYFAPEASAYNTREELRANFEEEITSVIEDHKEWVESKGETFDPSIHHPWGEGVFEALRRWFDVSPYTLWRLYEDSVDAGADILRDDVESILDGSEGTARVADKMREKFEDSMERWIKDNGCV